VVTILIQPLVTAVIYREVWRQAMHYVLTVILHCKTIVSSALPSVVGGLYRDFLYRHVFIE
jgi:hypothetical protein